jgi:hypothetical protein
MPVLQSNMGFVYTRGREGGNKPLPVPKICWWDGHLARHSRILKDKSPAKDWF